MRNMVNIAILDLRVFLADRGNLVTLIAMPVVMAVILGGALGGGGPSIVRLDVIDLDGSDLSQQLMADLRAENEVLVLCPADQDEEDLCQLNAVEGLEDPAALTVEQAQQRVADGVTAALLVIPAGYGADVQAFHEITLPYYSQANLTTGDAVLPSVQAVLQRVNGAAVAARVGVEMGNRLAGPGEDGSIFADETARASFGQAAYEAATDLWAEEPVEVHYALTQQEEEEDTGIDSTAYSQSVPGMATMFVLFTVLGGMGLLLRERKQWTLQRVVVMPVRRAEILGGKILARFATGILQFAVLTLVGLAVGLDFGNDLPALIVIAVAYTLCVTALAFALAPMIRTEEQAGVLTMMIGLPGAALGGAWWPLEVVPDFMKVIGHISPVAWAMDGFHELLFNGSRLGDVLAPVAVLLAATAVLFIIGVRRFKYE